MAARARVSQRLGEEPQPSMFGPEHGEKSARSAKSRGMAVRRKRNPHHRRDGLELLARRRRGLRGPAGNADRFVVRRREACQQRGNARDRKSCGWRNAGGTAEGALHAAQDRKTTIRACAVKRRLRRRRWGTRSQKHEPRRQIDGERNDAVLCYLHRRAAIVWLCQQKE